MSHEEIMSATYKTNAWGAKASRSGPSATLEKTAQIRPALQSFLKSENISSILDIGCGDWTWMQMMDLSGIQYKGIEIVEDCVKALQKHSASSVEFEQGNILAMPPTPTDLWLARDVCNLWSYADCILFFELFVASESTFLAITSLQTTENKDGPTGTWRPLNLRSAPFILPEPVHILPDQQQWFREKQLFVYTHAQIVEWLKLNRARLEAVLGRKLHDTLDRNSHLASNVPLRHASLYGHMGSLQSSLVSVAPS